MALTHAQYEAIQRIYDQRQLSFQRKNEELQKQLEKDYPDIKQLRQKLLSLRMELAKAKIMDGQTTLIQASKTALEKAKEEYQTYLKDHHIQIKDYEAKHHCSLCNDSGMIGGKSCSCYHKEVLQLLYKEAHLEGILDTETFEDFCLDFYPIDKIDTNTQKSAYELAKEAFDYMTQLGLHFKEQTLNHNILLFGSPGVGKTYLSHALAGLLMKQGYSCLYYSSFSLFELLGDYHFKTNEKANNIYPYLLECDMLMIDDLGTEVANQFTLAQLFALINERFLLNKATLISTNLDLVQLSKHYGERIFSRLSGQFHLLKLIGHDIRLQKKIQQH